jgi:hypothetical protein
MKLVLYFVAFAAGFLACVGLSRRRTPPERRDPWEAKYREMFQRYRDLTLRLETIDRMSENKANLMRQSLLKVAGLLRPADGINSERALEALREIDSALKDS